MYKTAEATVVSGVILSIIFLMVELIILFSGLTIFNEPTNMLCSFFIIKYKRLCSILWDVYQLLGILSCNGTI